MQDFRKLHVWARAHALALEIYRVANQLGRGHGALASQMRRAAMSISANITEGCGQLHASEFARYLHIALASASELDYHLKCAGDLGLLDVPRHQALEQEAREIRRMLFALRRRVLEKPATCARRGRELPADDCATDD